MLRLLIFLAALALAAWGVSWLASNPGDVTLTWRGVEYQASLMLALGAVAALAIALAIVWALLRFVFSIPSLVSLSARAHKREKGYLALSGGSQSAVAAYNAMLVHHETHGLGLRGLHLEARRAGDHEAALEYAMRANARAPAAWAGQAVLDDRTRRGDWAGALATVDTNAAAKLIDKPTANRWRAVIKTAMAEAAMERDPKHALAQAQEACRLAPTLVPAAAICGRLMAQAGDYRRASRILEAAYAQTPHPDLAAAYIRLRHGDSTEDRLTRARTLARMAPNDPESPLTVGRAALEARELSAARAAIAPLIASDSPDGRPTRRVCLLMADIEEADGNHGAVREWLGRAARAPHDKAWVADGVISDRWAPVSPSGTLDAFVWRTPDERLAPYVEPPPIEPDAPTAPPQIVAPTPTPSPAPQAVAAQVLAPA